MNPASLLTDILSFGVRLAENEFASEAEAIAELRKKLDERERAQARAEDALAEHDRDAEERIARLPPSPVLVPAAPPPAPAPLLPSVAAPAAPPPLPPPPPAPPAEDPRMSWVPTGAIFYGAFAGAKDWRTRTGVPMLTFAALPELMQRAFAAAAAKARQSDDAAQVYAAYCEVVGVAMGGEPLPAWDALVDQAAWAAGAAAARRGA